MRLQLVESALGIHALPGNCVIASFFFSHIIILSLHGHPSVPYCVNSAKRFLALNSRQARVLEYARLVYVKCVRPGPDMSQIHVCMQPAPTVTCICKDYYLLTLSKNQTVCCCLHPSLKELNKCSPNVNHRRSFLKSWTWVSTR